MKVLVLSDSHGCFDRLKSVLRRESDCSPVFFLGDGLRDLEYARAAFPEKSFICVRGNNDWNAAGCEEFAYKYIAGHTVLATHGHRVGVRQTLQELAAKAAAVRADVALYGHTHLARQAFCGGVLCINPGALCNGQYAVLEFDSAGVDVAFKTV